MITVLNHNGDTAFSDTEQVQVQVYLPVGTLVVVQGTANNGTIAFSDNVGNTYTHQTQVANPGVWVHNTAYCFLEYAMWPGHHIQIDSPGADLSGIQFTAFWGVESFDQQSDEQDFDFPDTDEMFSGEITTTYADELLVTNAIATGFESFDPSPGFTELGTMWTTTDASSLWHEYMVVDEIGTYESTPIVTSSETYWQCRILSFKLLANPEPAPITANFQIANGDDDGSGWMSDTEWPPDPVTGTWNNDTSNFVYAARGNYYDNNAFWRWDTSSLPDDIEIVTASLRINCNSRSSSDGFTISAQWYDFGGEPTVHADYAQNMDPSIFPVPYDMAQTAGQFFVFWIDDFSGINTSGYTGIRMGLNDDEVSQPTVDNHLRMVGYEDSGADYAGQLTVVYHLPTSTFKPRAIII